MGDEFDFFLMRAQDVRENKVAVVTLREGMLTLGTHRERR